MIVVFVSVVVLVFVVSIVVDCCMSLFVDWMLNVVFFMVGMELIWLFGVV